MILVKFINALWVIQLDSRTVDKFKNINVCLKLTSAKTGDHIWKALLKVEELCSPRPWCKGGHLDLLRFPVTQMCVCVRWHLSSRLRQSVPDFVDAIFPTVFCQWLSNSQIWHGDHGLDLELMNFSWLWLNFQGHRRSCFKINFVYAIFPVVLCGSWLSN